MSVRASGNPGSARRATRVALVLGLLTALAGPLAPLTAAAGGVTVTTPFPAIVAEPGSTASFKLAIDVSSARQVSLKAEDVPSGWTARFRGGGLVIDGAYVTPGDTPDVTLDVEIPDDAAAGSTNLRVVATGGGGVDTLPLTIRVADAAAGDVTLTSRLPRAPGRQRLDVHVQRHAPQRHGRGHDVHDAGDRPGRLDRRRQAAEPGTGDDPHGRTPVPPATSRSPPTRASTPAAGSYPITLDDERRRQGRDPRPRGHDHRHLHAHASARPTRSCRRRPTRAPRRSSRSSLANTGSAPVTGVAFSSTTPTGWTVEFTPADAATVDPGTPVPVTATITPSADAIAGDYELTITAKGAEASDDVTIRVRVETPQLWWIVGVVLIVARVRGPVLGLPDVRAAIGR